MIVELFGTTVLNAAPDVSVSRLDLVSLQLLAGLVYDRCIWGEKDEPSWSEKRRRLESRRVAKSGLALVTERPSVGMKRRIEKDSLSFLILAMARKTKRKDRSNGKAFA
jgi:hypothetical protein